MRKDRTFGIDILQRVRKRTIGVSADCEGIQTQWFRGIGQGKYDRLSRGRVPAIEGDCRVIAVEFLYDLA